MKISSKFLTLLNKLLKFFGFYLFVARFTNGTQFELCKYIDGVPNVKLFRYLVPVHRFKDLFNIKAHINRRKWIKEANKLRHGDFQ